MPTLNKTISNLVLSLFLILSCLCVKMLVLNVLLILGLILNSVLVSYSDYICLNLSSHRTSETLQPRIARSQIAGQACFKLNCSCSLEPSIEHTVNETQVANQSLTSSSSNITYSEIDCVFPFYMNKSWHDRCVSSDRGASFYCSIDKFFNNRLAKCEQECPKLARDLMKDEPASTLHTSCLNSTPNTISLFPEDHQSLVKIILDMHNTARSEVRPSATNMRALSWDTSLARLAQRWAENCVLAHDCFNCRKMINNDSVPTGQNIFALFGAAPLTRLNLTSIWSSAVNMWIDEKRSFQYGYGSTTGKFHDIGHYTQVICAQTARVGCGAALCDGNKLYAVCDYALGQYDTQKPYESGETCSKCSKKCADNLCSGCGDKLCANYGQLNLTTCECMCNYPFQGEYCEIDTRRLN